MTSHSASLAKTLKAASSECDRRGIRLTPKRQQVLTVLLKSDKPLSAYEVADQYRKQSGEAIIPVSVYRMLDVLQTAGLVHKLEGNGRYLACAHITCDHAHSSAQFLVCDQCESVEEIELRESLLTELRQQIKTRDFSMNHPQLEIHGVCGNCKRAQSKQ